MACSPQARSPGSGRGEPHCALSYAAIFTNRIRHVNEGTEVSEPTTSSTRRRRGPMRNRAINEVKHPPSCGVHWHNLQLHSLIAIAALLLLTSRAAAQTGTTYYVSTSGSDTNPGTIGA